MTRSYADYLRDILDMIAKVQRFVSGVNQVEFAANEEKVFAVIRALEVIGEAVKYIPKAERDRYPQIPWQAVAGMRDKLIHGYFVVSVNRVWLTVQQDLPSLQEIVTQMLAELDTKE